MTRLVRKFLIIQTNGEIYISFFKNFFFSSIKEQINCVVDLLQKYCGNDSAGFECSFIVLGTIKQRSDCIDTLPTCPTTNEMLPTKFDYPMNPRPSPKFLKNYIFWPL